MAYFISDQDSKKGTDPNIHIIDGIHNIKRITYVNVVISNYTNKHITFNKGKYVGHLESPIEDMQQIPEDPKSLTTYSITTERMMAKKVEPDTFKPPCHKLRKIAKSLTHHKAKFEWTPAHHTAFMMLKEAIIQASILHYPDPTR